MGVPLEAIIRRKNLVDLRAQDISNWRRNRVIYVPHPADPSVRNFAAVESVFAAGTTAVTMDSKPKINQNESRIETKPPLPEITQVLFPITVGALFLIVATQSLRKVNVALDRINLNPSLRLAIRAFEAAVLLGGTALLTGDKSPLKVIAAEPANIAPKNAAPARDPIPVDQQDRNENSIPDPVIPSPTPLPTSFPTEKPEPKPTKPSPSSAPSNTPKPIPSEAPKSTIAPPNPTIPATIAPKSNETNPFAGWTSLEGSHPDQLFSPVLTTFPDWCKSIQGYTFVGYANYTSLSLDQVLAEISKGNSTRFKFRCAVFGSKTSIDIYGK